MTDQTAERLLLRAVLTWARANGWTPRDRWGGTDSGPVTWAWGSDIEPGVPGMYVGINLPDELDEGSTLFTETAEIKHLTSVRAAVDVLVALRRLPVAFSTAYFVGHEDGGNEVSADAVERGVEVQMETLLDRLDNDDTRHALGDWYDGYLLDPPLLPADPYERRIRLEAIAEGVSEILGAPNAS